MSEAEKRIREALSVASIEPRDECFKVDTDDLTALLADHAEREAALRAEVEALKSDNDSYREAANGYLAEVEALEREVEALRAERDQLAEFVIAVGGFWGHSKSKLVGESSLAEVINRSIEDEDALRKDAECFRLLKARMGAAIDAALAQAKEKPDA